MQTSGSDVRLSLANQRRLFKEGHLQYMPAASVTPIVDAWPPMRLIDVCAVINGTNVHDADLHIVSDSVRDASRGVVAEPTRSVLVSIDGNAGFDGH